MAKGNSGLASGNNISNVKTKPFREMNIAEKKQAIKDFEKSLDNRFKSYDYDKYKIYKISDGQYAAYQFDNLSDSLVQKATNTSYFAVAYGKTLKSLKSELK